MCKTNLKIVILNGRETCKRTSNVQEAKGENYFDSDYTRSNAELSFHDKKY